MKLKNYRFLPAFFLILLFTFCSGPESKVHSYLSEELALKTGFKNPPDSVRPGVYWYFMDGNMSADAMTKDLESMKEAGIGNVIFLEVNVGVPRGPVEFLSNQWQDLFKHAVNEAERLGIVITLGTGPGWTGSGGPWVKPSQSMQHLVASSFEIKGPASMVPSLAKPDPRRPFFGEEGFTKNLRQQWRDYYEDVAVLAFPTPNGKEFIKSIDEKALYYRSPFSSQPGVKPFLRTSANYPADSLSSAIDQKNIIDITKYLQPDGSVKWKVPPGTWTIMRFGRRNNGAITRPAPMPGLGFESDKFDTTAFNAHFDAYFEKLIAKVGHPDKNKNGGWKVLHMDSWEMGAQNWTENFRQEFIKRRKYDPLPYLPVYTGRIVGSLEISERFLWDLRLTAQELIIENHAERLKSVGHKNGFKLSIEPYDMNPTADLVLGAVADVPMCEFWSRGFGFSTAFSCFEATSIAHTLGKSVCAAESFTAGEEEAFKQFPGSMKSQGDWAFCTGVNRFVFHTFAHKPLPEKYRPGMTMGPYGVHWDRGQTWWPMVSEYHKYVSRCSYILQQGRTIADILYLTPEGAPQVFRPPYSAVEGNDTMPDHKGFNFDGCSPNLLISKADVKDHKIVFPGGASYQLLVLPAIQTMTPELLSKIDQLLKNGATIIGTPPVKSPSLVNFPECDKLILSKAQEIWGSLNAPSTITERKYGDGKIFWGGDFVVRDTSQLYPDYKPTAELLSKLGLAEDFKATGPVRYIHRKTDKLDIYFLANKTNQPADAECQFRSNGSEPELWDPLTGETRPLPEYKQKDGLISIPLQFEANQSFFIILKQSGVRESKKSPGKKNFPVVNVVADIEGPWTVSFDPIWGGPGKVEFNKLTDWTKRREEGIKYYSGIAVYHKTFQFKESVPSASLYLNLGDVKNLARVRLNGKDLGVLWTNPWQVNITNAVKQGENELEIEVANLWPNRLIGDEKFPDDGIKDNKWPAWLLNGKPRPTGRFTFITHKFYSKDSPLLRSGLMGPVKILSIDQK